MPPHPLAGMLQQHLYHSRLARPTENCFLQDLSLQIVCSLEPGITCMCSSYDVVHVLTFGVTTSVMHLQRVSLWGTIDNKSFHAEK